MGITGIFLDESQKDVALVTYKSLFALQHRGQAFTGMITIGEGKVFRHFGPGIISNVFSNELLHSIKGNVSIGQVFNRRSDKKNLPVINRFRYGNIAIAYEGKIGNIEELRESLKEDGISFATDSDGEVIISLIAKKSHQGLEKAIATTVNELSGSFSMIIMTDDRIFGMRDENGVFPLCLGRLKHGWILANESGAIESVGGEFFRDISPGEMTIIDGEGLFSFEFRHMKKKLACAYEYTYFSRQDSNLDGISIQESRLRVGAALAQKFPVKADIVVGIPDSGISFAMGYSNASGIPYAQGIVKNIFASRSDDLFDTGAVVCRKLNVLRSDVEGKRVIVVDDSVVSGITIKELSRRLKRAGALEVHFRIATPTVKTNCVYNSPAFPIRSGDFVDAEKLKEEICADPSQSLEFLPVEDLLNALKSPCPEADGFCTKCIE